MPPPSGSRQHQKGVWNTVILFCVLLVMTAVMFQRATTSVQRTENEIAAVTAATDAALVSGGGATEKQRHVPEATSIISNILSKAKEAIGGPGSEEEGTQDGGSSGVKGGLDAEEAAQLVKTLLSRVKPALGWAATLGKDVNRFDKISNAEIHILHKLYRFLKAVDASLAGKASSGSGTSGTSGSSGSGKSASTPLRKGPTAEAGSDALRAQKKEAGLDLVAFVSRGYQCSATERLQQEAIAKTIERDICSEIEWYKGAFVRTCTHAFIPSSPLTAHDHAKYI